MRWVAAGLVVCVASVASWAAAQPGEAAAEGAKWLVVPAFGATVGRAGVEGLHQASEAVRHELSVRGASVWPADRASERFEAVGSAPAPRVSQSDIDRWVERSRAAVRYLARADYKAARRELKAAQRLADRAAAELNREAARAQQVLDTCLFMVRAYVETKNTADARRQARECRQLVPRVEPSAFRHTPEVRDLLAEVDAEMAAEAPGTLEVNSTPSDCLVRINGVEFGRTPLSGVELPVGMYRVQVECEADERGRIHRVAVESGVNRVSLDADFERAVRTRPVLHLRYLSDEAWATRMTHAGEVAQVLGGARVLVVSEAEGAVRIDLAGEGHAPASVWLSVPDRAPGAEDVRRGVDALLEGRSVDFSGAHPLARSSWAEEVAVAAAVASVSEASSAAGAGGESEQARPRVRGVPQPRAHRIAGWTLLGAGVASLGTSVGLHAWRGELGDRFVESPANLRAAQQWNDARVGVWVTAAFGGAAMSTAMPLVLPGYARPPWWSWMLGGFGLGLTGYAIYEGVTMQRCPEPFIADEARVRACVARGQEAGRVALAVAGAAPLLTVPLVYWVRPLRAEPSVSVTRDGAVLRVGGVF